jgi:hypothetical protein
MAALSEIAYKGVVVVNPWGISCRECLFAKRDCGERERCIATGMHGGGDIRIRNDPVVEGA